MTKDQATQWVIYADELAAKQGTNYEKLVDFFIKTDLMGHYDTRNMSITLYGVWNEQRILTTIKYCMDKITSNYQFIVLMPTHPVSNINILDIDL